MAEGNGPIETSAEARCPVCGKKCVLRTVRSLRGEVVSAAADCPACGRTPVVYKVLPTGDRRLLLADGSVYEPSDTVFRLREEARSQTGPDALRTRLEIADALRHDEREREAVSDCLSIIDDALGTCPPTPEARDMAISAAYIAGRIMGWEGDTGASEKIYGKVLKYAEESCSEDAAGLRVEYALSSMLDGPEPAGGGILRGMADEIEKDGGTAYRGSAMAAATVYGGLASALAFKRMMKPSFTAARKAVRCAEAAVGTSPSEEAAAALLHALYLCSSAAYAAGNPGKGREYAKKLLRTSESFRSGYPQQYAEGMLLFAKAAADSDPGLVPESRKRMEDLIAFLLEKKEDGFCDERAAMAYLYHSDPGAGGELDRADLERAYAIMKENAFRGKSGRDAFMHVGNSYLVYLQEKDPERADAVRAEMREMGLFRSLRDEGYDPEEIRRASASGGVRSGDNGSDRFRNRSTYNTDDAIGKVKEGRYCSRR